MQITTPNDSFTMQSGSCCVMRNGGILLDRPICVYPFTTGKMKCELISVQGKLTTDLKLI